MIAAVIVAIAVLSAVIVIARALCIIERLHWRTHGQGYAHFLGCGLSYVALAAGALLVALEAWGGVATLGALLVIFASAGLIVFDKRGPRR